MPGEEKIYILGLQNDAMAERIRLWGCGGVNEGGRMGDRFEYGMMGDGTGIDNVTPDEIQKTTRQRHC